MDHSFTEMKGTLGNLAYVEESANEEGSVNSDTEKETDKAPNKDSASTNDQHLSGSSNANNVNNWLTLTNNTSPTDPKSFKEENSTLAGIASNLKLGQKKAPAVNAQFAGIMKGHACQTWWRYIDRDEKSLYQARKLQVLGANPG